MSEHALTITDFARMGGRARAQSLSPEARKASSHKAYLAGAVRSIARYRDDLTEDQKDRIFAALFDLDDDE
jgi:hypothetical protein